MKKSSWNKEISEELEEFLQKERGEYEVFPPTEEVFQAFELTPFEKVKVVILGQDPYHGPGQAHGLCFSVKKGEKQPPSLKNIFKELQGDLGIEKPLHGYLGKWAEGGVFLLNTTLTVRKGCPMSHKGKGWEQFTDRVLERLFSREDPIVFMLWGKVAEDKCKWNTKNHLVLKAGHPSPFSARYFLGCKHFSKANTFLEGVGKTPIDWSLY